MKPRFTNLLIPLFTFILFYILFYIAAPRQLHIETFISISAFTFFLGIFLLFGEINYVKLFVSCAVSNVLAEITFKAIWYYLHYTDIKSNFIKYVFPKNLFEYSLYMMLIKLIPFCLSYILYDLFLVWRKKKQFDKKEIFRFIKISIVVGFAIDFAAELIFHLQH